MTKLKSFAPGHLVPDAEASGFYQCRDCGMIWFGRHAEERMGMGCPFTLLSFAGHATSPFH